MKVHVAEMVPMSDGVKLATDVLMPDGPGPFPTLLMRTPYHRQGGGANYVAEGYAVAIQDCRGKFDSEGHFRPLVDEQRDGIDFVAWAADQSWCNERIGLIGASYLGFVQAPAASGQHEALRCMVPQVCSTSFFRQWARYNGCPSLYNALYWNLHNDVVPTRPRVTHIDWDEICRLRTLEEIFARVGFESETLRLWREHDSEDDYWREVDQVPLHEKVAVPGFHMGGWWDHHHDGQCETYAGIRDRGASQAAREGQRMMMGPWGHSTFGARGEAHRSYGQWDFGQQADVSTHLQAMRFLNLHLRDCDDGITDEPPVHVFLMGANRWLHLPDWPAPDAQEQSWFLHSTGHADGRRGPGGLSLETPGDEPADSFVYDPEDPMPTLGGPIYQVFETKGPIDQRPILDRGDLAYYRGEPLAQPLAIVGHVELEVWLASDAEDTDVMARLCVVEAGGSVTVIGVGSLRCKYRESFADPKALEPDTPTRMTVDLGHTACELPAGSRLALIVTSSSYPRIVPHPNVMAAPWSGAEPRKATQHILHDAAHPSRLVLPVLEM